LLSAPSFDQGLAAGGQGFMQGAQVDSAYRVAEEEKAARAAQINQTAQYLAQTFPDLAEAVNAGMPLDAAWNEAMKRSQPGYGQAGGDPFTLGPGQVRYGADGKPIAQGPAQSPENIFNIGGSDKFADTVATALGNQQVGLIDNGRNARTSNMLLGQLESHLSRAPQGGVGALVQFAGDVVGLPLEGLDDVQAAQALINEIVPTKRPPGSGPMSDADLDLFKKSTARIINQPGGNEYIIRTAKAINDYVIEQSRIAEDVVVGRLTLEEGLAQQAAVPNPLANFSGGAATPPAAGGLPPGVKIRRLD
jgi:hypothetical protein